MRKIVCFLLIGICFSSGLRLNLDSSIVISPGQKVNLPLSCSGSSGLVNYQVKGLPRGLLYSNGVIQGSSDILSGYFPVIIDAKDEKNNFVSQIIIFKIGGGVASSSQVTTVNNGQTVTSSIVSDGNTIISTAGGSSSTINFLQGSQQGNDNMNIFGANSMNQNINNGQNTLRSGVPLTSIMNNQNSNILPSGANNFGTPKSDVPINNLLNQFAPNLIPNRLSQNPSGDRRYYPTADLPTAPSPNATPNLTPLLIETAKAPRLPSDRNKITPDSVKATAIFERQLNSNKAIANLLDIIEQLTANTNAAKADIPTLDGEVKNTLAVQRQVQSKVITAENQRTRLNTAITNLNDNINILRKQLSDLQNSFKDSAQSVTSKKIQIGTINQSIRTYDDSYKAANDKVIKQKDLIKNIEAQIQDTHLQIQANKQDLDYKLKQSSNIDVQIQGAVRNVKNVDEEIADLKARLNAAIKRKGQAQQQQRKLRDIKINAPIVIGQLERKLLRGTQTLDRLNEQKTVANNDLTKMNSNLDEINLNLGRFKSQLSQVETEIKVVTGNGQDYDNAIAAKNKQINDAVANLQFLKGQVESYDTALRNAYNQGNDANARVQNAKQNLDALVQKWQRDTQSLSEATLNLEKARAEKQLSDLAMQQLVRQRSNALPYSIVPNGNGQTRLGTPTGNNPRGSPLGPVAVKNNQNSNNPFEVEANNIDSFTNYLSSAYAEGVDPAFPGSVTRNFPFTIYRSASNGKLRNDDQSNFVNIDGQKILGITKDSNGLLTFNGDFNCGNAPSELIDGYVRDVGNNAFYVEASNGKKYVVRVGSCSQAIANSPNYSLAIGDKIKFSGQASGKGVVNLYQATCDCAKCLQK